MNRTCTSRGGSLAGDVAPLTNGASVLCLCAIVQPITKSVRKIAWRYFGGSAREIEPSTVWTTFGCRNELAGLPPEAYGGTRAKLAEREGFEPSVEFPLHTLSKR